MMMSMLASGGLEPLTDNIRTANEDNPKGYFEFEQVKEIEKDSSWLDLAQGRAVKMISWLLKHLPDRYKYKIIFMRRNMDEVLASQKQMLIRRGQPADPVGDEKMAAMFQKHLAQIESWLKAQPNIEVAYVSYNEVLADPLPHIEAINSFLGGSLDVKAMAAVVDLTLYRQQQSGR